MDLMLATVPAAEVVRNAQTNTSSAIWVAAISMIGMVFTGILGLIGQWLSLRAQARAAVKVEAVKTTLDAATERTDGKLDNLTSVGNATHALVNSAMGLQLRSNWQLAERVVALTTDPDERLAAQRVAESAKQLYDEHQLKQAESDSREAANIRAATPVNVNIVSVPPGVVPS